MKTSSRSELKTWQEIETCDPVIYASDEVHAVAPLPAQLPDIRPNCDCGSHNARWYGDRCGLRQFMCDECAQLAGLAEPDVASLAATNSKFRTAIAEIIRIGFTESNDVQARDQMLAIARAALEASK